MRQELLNGLCVENCFHYNQGHIKYKTSTKKHKNRKNAIVYFVLFVALLRRRSGCRCCCRVLAVEVGNKRARDVDTVRGIQQRHLRTVDDHVDATRLGKSFERFANLFLQRRKSSWRR